MKNGNGRVLTKLLGNDGKTPIRLKGAFVYVDMIRGFRYQRRKIDGKFVLKRINKTSPKIRTSPNMNLTPRTFSKQIINKAKRIFERGHKIHAQFTPATFSRINRRIEFLTGKKLDIVIYNINKPTSFKLKDLKRHISIKGPRWIPKNATKPFFRNLTNENKNTLEEPYLMKFMLHPYLDEAHATAGFVSGNTLYYFNPWGENSLIKDKQFISYLRGEHGFKVIKYTGPSLQLKYEDPYGVCSAYASNFLVEMAFLHHKKEMDEVKTQIKYNRFIHETLRDRSACFGDKYTGNLNKFHRAMFKNVFSNTAYPTPKKLSSLSNENIKKYTLGRYGRELTRKELKKLIESTKNKLRKNIS